MRKICLSILLMLLLSGCAFSETVKETTDPSNMTAAVQETVTIPPPVTAAVAETTAATEAVPTAMEETQRETGPDPDLSQPEPADEAFVMVQAYIPDLAVDLRYATDNNFTGQVIYESDILWLRYGTVKKLMRVQEELRQQGLGLKVWDGFRPASAQFRLWEICPDPVYVSNPNNGFSKHSRGNTLDVTLVYADGTEAVMPTAFDDFSKLADRDYSDCTEESAQNAILLENVMKKYGFKPYSGEWWHFTDTQTYPVDEHFMPVEAVWHFADCTEYITLREKPDTAGNMITRIPVGESVQVVAEYADYALVLYGHLWGYVLRAYIQPSC